ncbi:hypothetical protein EDD16DRAFT_1491623 [Pisolithus croceorrhizus]|nr:hypothetical protein EV401DRAFT_1879485 [Pisolithus croceorrhizus]KAI6105225.1 hypothetical protein EDD16DRAFT_1491623 [Pisolithus croceorrhizus]KAI6169180.1 hypothetical protein EDD17DRAFT_1464847 [Pisolithus thermaeus]
MLQGAVLCTLASLGALCRAAQAPLATPHVGPQVGGSTGEVPDKERLFPSDNPHSAAGYLPVDHDHDAFVDWQFDDAPNVNSTSHLVFETVSSLLQHWPNTRMRNGHNIVPGTIPPGTLLYHGTWHSDLPSGPEWTATDPEHSILFCRNTVGEDGCWHLTLMTTRPLKVVYFDGSSAAKAPFGSMDAQDIISWGAVRPDRAFEEGDRIKALCEWGREYDVDGFVRMEMDFEVMLCDFTSGVRVVSSLALAKAGTSSKASRMFEVMYAGSWHNRYPGETRVQLDLSGLISFYDTELVPSLVPARFGKERWDHRLLNISGEDLAQARARLEKFLSKPAGRSGSGIDWLALIRVVVDRYSDRLEFARYLLNSTSPETADSDSMTDVAIKTQVQLRNILAPYILFDVIPPSIMLKTEVRGLDVLDWARPVYRLCATTHTGMLEDNTMTSSEKLLLDAVQGTTREICRVVTKMWGLGVLAGVDRFMGTEREPDVETIQNVVKTWNEDIAELMAWLDWNVWVKCRPACGLEEMCYLTTWPIGFPKRDRPRPPKNRDPVPPSPSHPSENDAPAPTRPPWGGGPPHGEPAEDWERPQPRCVRRIDPYTI